jgi:branched-chain amino acid transport system ATP-binding protein
MPTSAGALVVENLHVRYGPINALSDVSLEVEPGSVVAVLGANGAGKSTLLRALSGLVTAASGSIRLQGEPVQGRKPFEITQRGMAHVPEGRRVVAPLSVEDNLVLAAKAAHRRDQASVTAALDEVYSLFPRLRERRQQTSGLLSGGEQQMLAIGRGLMARPVILMLDEPSMGLAPIVIEEIYELLRNRRGTLSEVGILLAEQSIAMALSVAERTYVLSQGHVIFEGTPEEVGNNRSVLDAYFGGRNET